MTASTEELQAFMDRENLLNLVRVERWARDQRRFDLMADCFHEKAWVRTSWYNGVGGQNYVDATRANMGDRNDATYSGKHWVFPAFVQVNGDRATVESPAKLFGRQQIGGIDAATHIYCRLYSRAVRQETGWKLLTFHVLFEWDELRAAIPGLVPELDYDLLNSMRPSYRFLSYVQALRGNKINHDLLGDDRWDELMAFHERESAWLAGAGAIDDTDYPG